MNPLLEVFEDDRPWAITPGAIRALVATAQNPDIQALASRAGQPLEDDGSVTNYNGTAVVEVRGPLFRYRSIWTWLLGGTSMEETAAGLQAALDDPKVRSIVLDINSPGGQIDGINEMANKIRAANAQKPVTAYVGGTAASGAYWLASAAGRIVADETASLGSIGVLATVLDTSGADEKRGVKRYEVISSQSPLKRTDPSTDQGREQLQQHVDALAQIFLEKVAAFRGTTADRVARDYGRGAVLPARSAIGLGMADALGSLEDLLQPDLAAPVRVVRDQPGIRVDTDQEGLEEDEDRLLLAARDDKKDDDDDENDEPDDDEDDDEDEEDPERRRASSAEGEGLIMQDDERQRIAAILTCEEARGREDLARVLALETKHSLEAAKKLLLAAPVATKPNALEAHMAQIPNPQVGVSADAVENETAAEVAKILAYVPKSRRRMHVQ